MDTYLEKAIQAAGGAAALARSFGIKSQAISQWDKAPDGRVLAIAEATGWQVTPHQLRPDLYPYPSDALPKDKRKAA